VGFFERGLELEQRISLAVAGGSCADLAEGFIETSAGLHKIIDAEISATGVA